MVRHAWDKRSILNCDRDCARTLPAPCTTSHHCGGYYQNQDDFRMADQFLADVLQPAGVDQPFAMPADHRPAITVVFGQGGDRRQHEFLHQNHFGKTGGGSGSGFCGGVVVAVAAERWLRQDSLGGSRMLIEREGKLWPRGRRAPLTGCDGWTATLLRCLSVPIDPAAGLGDQSKVSRDCPPDKADNVSHYDT